VENELLQLQLERAQGVLASALDEACGVNLGQASTDELVRIEETLATASTAAKEVVSIRLRRRQRRGGAKSSKPELEKEPASMMADVVPAISQRIFDDIRGKRWRVFAVHPSEATLDSGALPDSFRDGWLSFEAVDEKRRVAPIPAGWEELSIDELQLLCHRAQRAPKRVSNPMRPPPESPPTTQ
jgi:hypothetical protein